MPRVYTGKLRHILVVARKGAILLMVFKMQKKSKKSFNKLNEFCIEQLWHSLTNIQLSVQKPAMTVMIGVSDILAIKVYQFC